MYPLHNTVIVITLLCIALCNAAIFYTIFQIIRILRCTSNQFLVFAAELLDLLDPPPPPSPAAVNGTPSVRSSSMASDSGLGDLVAGHAGRDAPLSPVLAGSPPPFTGFKVLPLNEEELWPVSRSPSPQERENLGLVMCSWEESPNGRQLGYPAAREGRTGYSTSLVSVATAAAAAAAAIIAAAAAVARAQDNSLLLFLLELQAAGCIGEG
ncbi:hypothetical protein NHJ6243_001568 [Beauveria neobassiana]